AGRAGPWARAGLHQGQDVDLIGLTFRDAVVSLDVGLDLRQPSRQAVLHLQRLAECDCCHWCVTSLLNSTPSRTPGVPIRFAGDSGGTATHCHVRARMTPEGASARVAMGTWKYLRVILLPVI